MKTLTKAYDELYDYISEVEPEVEDRFIKYLIKKEENK